MIVPGNTIKLVDVGASNAVVPEVQSQSPVVKAVRNIKKKNAGAYIRLQPTSSQTGKTNSQKETGNVISGRGVVYLSHIPDGFYEDEMRQYFSQFGRVTRVKLARSRKTGRSRGYAFIEFQYAEVAKVVAETMNNYLLYNRLLKASYVDKQYPAAFWNQSSCGPQNCPLARNRQIEIKRKNAVLTSAKEQARRGKRRRQLAKTLNRLKDAGVDYAVQVKNEVELSTGPEKKAKKIGGARNMEQVSEENVKVEEVSRNIQPVLLVDESDDEIEFNVPSFVIRKTLKRQSSSPSAKPLPPVKKGKCVKRESPTPEVTSPTRNNVSSEGNQNTGASLGVSQKTRKSSRVSVIPKHISSGFQVTMTSLKSKQKESLGKERRDSRSPANCMELSEKLSTPKAVHTPSQSLRKSLETSTKKKIKSPKTPAENNIVKSPENTEMTSPNQHRMSAKASEISNGVMYGSSTDSILKTGPHKADKSTDSTLKHEKDNANTANKRKSPKFAVISDNEAKKVPAASEVERIISPNSKGKKAMPKKVPNQLSPMRKPNSVERNVKAQKSALKTPAGRKSFPLSKQSSSVQKHNSGEKKPKELKTPLKTPLGKKSKGKSPPSSPKLSPLYHSTALKKRNSASPKMVKRARKSLKLNK